MTELRFPEQAPSQMARHFLALLGDVNRIHGMFMDEIATLQAQVAALETCKGSVAEPFLNVPDASGCAVYMVSKEGLIQSWSGGAGELYGYSVEEVVQQPWTVLQPGQEGSGSATRPCVQVAQRRKKDGRVFEVYFHHTVLLDGKGQACGRMHVEIPLAIHGTVGEGGAQ